MSMGAYRWAKSWNEGLTSPQMFVLIMLADHYNETAKRAWPAIDTLARMTRLSPATVKRALRDLKSMGLIEVEYWFDNSTGRQKSNRYCLPFYDSESQVSPHPVVIEYDIKGRAVGFTEEGVEIAIAV